VKTKMTMMVLSDNEGNIRRTNSLPARMRSGRQRQDLGATPQSVPTSSCKKDQTATVTHYAEDLGAVESVDKVSRRSVVAGGQGEDVVLQECFNCHAMSKIGVEGRDRDAWLEAIEHMRQVGVANIKPDVADQSRIIWKRFLSGFRCAEIAAQLPQYQKVKQERDYFTDDALNIVYVIIR